MTKLSLSLAGLVLLLAWNVIAQPVYPPPKAGAGGSTGYLTNAGLPTIVFNGVYEYRDFPTNAAFAFLGFSGASASNMQTTVYFVTNTTASAWAITPPAGMGATNGVWYCTNLTALTFVNNGRKWTNGASYPLR